MSWQQTPVEMTHGTYSDNPCLNQVAFAYLPRHFRIHLGSVRFDHVTMLRLPLTSPHRPKPVLESEGQLLPSSRAVLGMMLKLDIRQLAVQNTL